MVDKLTAPLSSVQSHNKQLEANQNTENITARIEHDGVSSQTPEFIALEVIDTKLIDADPVPQNTKDDYHLVDTFQEAVSQLFFSLALEVSATSWTCSKWFWCVSKVSHYFDVLY